MTLGAIPLRNTLPVILLTINCNWSPNFSTSNISRKQISLQSYFIELTEQEVKCYAIFAGYLACNRTGTLKVNSI